MLMVCVIFATILDAKGVRCNRKYLSFTDQHQQCYDSSCNIPYDSGGCQYTEYDTENVVCDCFQSKYIYCGPAPSIAVEVGYVKRIAGTCDNGNCSETQRGDADTVTLYPPLETNDCWPADYVKSTSKHDYVDNIGIISGCGCGIIIVLCPGLRRKPL